MAMTEKAMALPNKLKPGDLWVCPNHLCEREHQLMQLLQQRDHSHTCTCGLTTTWRPNDDGTVDCINGEMSGQGIRR